MSDLISRADAIEAVRKELVCDGRHETHDKTCRFIADVLLSALPSADITETDGVITIGKESAKDVGEIKHIIICSPNYTRYFYNESMPITSAEAEQTIRHIENNTKESDLVYRPSAEAEWIPCSERLPDDDGDYLVWLEDESDHYAVVYFDTGADAFGWWVDHYDPITLGFIESDFCEAKNITAWQPLPTPYKGGDSE